LCAMDLDTPSVWAEFSPLARECNAVNMGQGFPNFDTPAFIKEHGKDAIAEGFNQYTGSRGHARLQRALAAKYAPRLGRDSIDGSKEVFVGVGASETLYCAIMAFTQEEGSEVVVFEPKFDLYAAQAQLCRATVRPVPLHVQTVAETGVKRWTFSMEALEAAFTDKTRLLIINTPHNPTGMVFSRAELERIGMMLEKYPKCTLLSDEVYEHLVYDGAEHVSIASLSDALYSKTVTISSGGKMFTATGWKVGWAIGPESLITKLWSIHQWIPFSVATPLQEGIARVIEQADQPYEGESSYYEWLRKLFQAKRDRLMKALADAGIRAVNAEGGYFVMVETADLHVPLSYLSAQPKVARDWALARYLTREVGVSPIPPSAFHCKENEEHAINYLRFAFCKEDSDIDECGRRLQKRDLKQPPPS